MDIEIRCPECGKKIVFGDVLFDDEEPCEYATTCPKCKQPYCLEVSPQIVEPRATSQNEKGEPCVVMTVQITATLKKE